MSGHPRGDAIVAAVRQCVGTRFGAQGRLAGQSLDCIGVALIAASAAGHAIAAPPYALGGDHEAQLDDVVATLGCRRVDLARPGDLLVLAPGPARRHLAIATPRGIVHAHAGLRRVVEGPLDPTWTLIAAWRFAEGA